jgi:hypothetical protein
LGCTVFVIGFPPHSLLDVLLGEVCAGGQWPWPNMRPAMWTSDARNGARIVKNRLANAAFMPPFGHNLASSFANRPSAVIFVLRFVDFDHFPAVWSARKMAMKGYDHGTIHRHQSG